MGGHIWPITVVAWAGLGTWCGCGCPPGFTWVPHVTISGSLWSRLCMFDRDGICPTLYAAAINWLIDCNKIHRERSKITGGVSRYILITINIFCIVLVNLVFVGLAPWWLRQRLAACWVLSSWQRSFWQRHCEFWSDLQKSGLHGFKRTHFFQMLRPICQIFRQILIFELEICNNLENIICILC